MADGSPKGLANARYLLQQLPQQLPCPRREQLFQFRVGGVAGIDWVSQLLDQAVEYRAGGSPSG
jgi:hypothetical protein